MTKSDLRHIERTKELGCWVCRSLNLGPTPADAHHILSGGRRISHRHVIPLCPEWHHRGTMNKGEPDSEHVSVNFLKEFTRRYASELYILDQTWLELGYVPPQ